MPDRDNLNRSSIRPCIQNIDTAAQVADYLIKSDSNDGHTLRRVGLALHTAGDLPRCQTLLEMAQLLVPLNVSAELALAECYVATKDADLAVGLLENVARSESADTPTLLRAASLFKELGSFRNAWLACREAVRKSPDDAQAWFDLSVSMGRVGFPFSKIELVAQKAIDLEPDNVVFRVSLAAALSRLGREPHAYALVQRFGEKELRQICCSSCLECLRSLYKLVGDWRGVCLCNEQLVQQSVTEANDCCEESEE